MVNSIGEYNIARSSSSDIKNIKSSQRHPVDPNKPKKHKKKRNTSPTNIIYASDVKEKIDAKKLFIIENNTAKSKIKKKSGKSVQRSSASFCLIGPGFVRPAR
ncbi:MAG: hypothetical protein P8X97_04645 [Candidatus Bathyarchaeota archaeon]